MLKKILPIFAVAALLATPVFASQCPMDIGKIDAALKTSQLSDGDKADVMKLRDEGQKAHDGGDHAKSVETLAKAKAILKIE